MSAQEQDFPDDYFPVLFFPSRNLYLMAESREINWFNLPPETQIICAIKPGEVVPSRSHFDKAIAAHIDWMKD